MFQFAGFASQTYEFSLGYPLRGGFPHSEICGSLPARGSPQLIATCYVLHRLSVPRHPPDALKTLDLSKSADMRPCAGASPHTKPHHPPQDACPGNRWVVQTRRSSKDTSSVMFLTHSSLVHDPAPSVRRRSGVSQTRGVGPRRNPCCGVFPADDRYPSGDPLVEADGIEPTASCLQSTRSPN